MTGLRRLLLLIIVAGALPGCAPAGPPAPSPAAIGEMHLFLLAGQSNMAGRGEVEAQDRIPHPRIWMLDHNGEWVPATDPLHFHRSIAGVGPGMSFARVLVERDPDLVVGLIPTAVRGSPISTWEPGEAHERSGTHPYDDALRRTRVAMRAGELKAVLWHQGEGDANPKAAPLYQERLLRLVARLRDDLGNPDLPFLIGGLGCFADRRWSPSRAKVDSAHRALPGMVPHVAFVSAHGLGHRGDSVHFSTAAARELGRRYADAYLVMADGSRAPPAPAPDCGP